MEFVACNFCRSTEAEILFGGTDKLHDNGIAYSLVRCLNCGLLYLNPRPEREEMGKYYPNGYLAYRASMLHEWFPLAGRYLRELAMDRRCKEIHRFKTGGRLLDVGCSTGLFLEQMQQYPGWQLLGVEPHRPAATDARQRLGLDIFPGTVEEAHYPDECLEVVTLWDVFEHLHEPMKALRDFNRILKPGGLLVISIPNVHSLEARCFGPYWIGYDIPRHLYAYPLPTLRRMLPTAGFEVVQTRCFEGGYFTFALSLWILTKAKVSSPPIRSMCNRILFLQGMRFLFWPFTRLVDKLGKGSIVTVAAVKRQPRSRGAPKCDC